VTRLPNFRIIFHTCTYYSNKVLNELWVNERASTSTVQMEGHTISTTYTDSYGPKPFSRIDPAVKWDQKLDAEVFSRFFPDTKPKLYLPGEQLRLAGRSQRIAQLFRKFREHLRLVLQSLPQVFPKLHTPGSQFQNGNSPAH
jgi:hypothetical protein